MSERRRKYRYDVIVVGAGVGGCVLAKKASDAGFRVALLDKKKKESIGHGWEVACEKKIFGRVSLKFPEKSLLSQSPEYYRFSSEISDRYVEMNAKYDSVFYIQHKKLNQLMLEKALEAGAVLMDSCEIKAPLLDGRKILGVEAERERLLGHRRLALSGSVIADASGLERVIAGKMPEEAFIQAKIENTDMVSAWNEVCEISPEGEERLNDACSITPGGHVTQLGTHHAYQVLFVRTNGTASLIFGKVLGDENKSAYELAADFKKDYPFFGKRIYGGGKLIPIRRTIDNMVSDNFICLGDAACQVVPTTGSGISSSIYAADIAASVITEGLNSGDLTAKCLWKYNHNYQSKRGAILATYDLIRRFLQHLSQREMKMIFEAGLLLDENFIQIYASDRITYNINQIMENVRKIIANPAMLPIGLQMAQTLRDSERILHIYQNYPRTQDKVLFFAWLTQVARIFKKPAYFSEFAMMLSDNQH